MAYTASKLIAIAKAEIGYKEKATNANLDSKTANAGSNNWTKYGRDLGNAGYYGGSKNGYAWCDQFVDWCFLQLCGNKTAAEAMECQTGIYGAGCGFSMRYYKEQARFDKTAKVGDQIFFKYSNDGSGADHTGIVVDVTADKVITVEGNSGDRVQQHTYYKTDKTILGYGHPKYDAEPQKDEVKTVKIELPILRKGSTGTEVKTVQRILRQLEYVGLDNKPLAVDGDFGAGTEAAVKRFQLKRGAKNPDGIVGEWTWNRLLKAI